MTDLKPVAVAGDAVRGTDVPVSDIEAALSAAP